RRRRRASGSYGGGRGGSSSRGSGGPLWRMLQRSRSRWDGDAACFLSGEFPFRAGSRNHGDPRMRCKVALDLTLAAFDGLAAGGTGDGVAPPPVVSAVAAAVAGAAPKDPSFVQCLCFVHRAAALNPLSGGFAGRASGGGGAAGGGVGRDADASVHGGDGRDGGGGGGNSGGGGSNSGGGDGGGAFADVLALGGSYVIALFAADALRMLGARRDAQLRLYDPLMLPAAPGNL
ncbi:unnamed protein product, partial [Phaeothamnion confervicola]